MSYFTCTFDDKREPWITFDVPAVYSFIANKIGIEVKGTYGILLPSIQFYLEGMTVVLIASSLGAAISFIVYKYVLPIKKRQPYSSNTSFIVAFGVIIPVCFLFPYAFVAMTNIQSTITRQLICLPFVMYAFRCIEALFGFSPPTATSSPLKYAIYYMSPVEPVHNKKDGSAVKATTQDARQNLLVMVRTAVKMTICFSLLSFYGFEPFRSTNAAGDKLMIKDYLTLMHLGNCFIAAIMFQLGLQFTGAYFTFFRYILTGDKCVDTMRNPVLESTSPSDFWGRRWNMVAHGFLKRGVFKPMRKYFSAFVASLGAFIASGLFHEYIIHLVFMYKREPRRIYTSSCPKGILEYEQQLGSNMAFFAWNGVLIVIEKLLGKHQMVKFFVSKLPQFAITFLIIMTALPIAHWLSDPYVKGGYFYDLQEGFPIITKVT